ncbi:MAG: hypothetical protein ACYDGM_07395 [Vulcanimicrobiaceae bacterium]
MKCAPATAAPEHAVSALVDRINGVGLAEDSWAFPPWQSAFSSPFVEWYARFIVATGTKAPPSADDERAASTLIREVQSLPGAVVGAAIWSNTAGTTYNAADARRLHDALCVTTVTSTWPMDQDTAAPVERLMRDWLSDRARAAGAPLRYLSGFTDTLTRTATRLAAKSSHPFNALAVFFLNARFDEDADAFPKWITIPYYDHGKVHGIRLKSPSAAISLYVFTGQTPDVVAFRTAFSQETEYRFNDPQLAVEHWKSVQRQFKPTTIAISPLDLLIYGRKGFAPNLDALIHATDSYGTTVSTGYNQLTGVAQSDLLVRGSRLTLATVAGIEGTNAPKRFTIDIWPNPHPPVFALPTSMLYFVVDDRSGVILAEGFRAAP